MSRLGDALVRMRAEKAAREGRRVTQREVADALEVPHVYVSRWETGRNVPERYAVAQLARFYGADESALMDLREAAMAETDGRRMPSPTSPTAEELAADVLRRAAAAGPPPPAPTPEIATGERRRKMGRRASDPRPN